MSLCFLGNYGLSVTEILFAPEVQASLQESEQHRGGPGAHAEMFNTHHLCSRLHIPKTLPNKVKVYPHNAISSAKLLFFSVNEVKWTEWTSLNPNTLTLQIQDPTCYISCHWTLNLSYIWNRYINSCHK